MLFLPSNERSLGLLFAGDALATVVDQLVLLAIPTLALATLGLGAPQVSVLTSAQWMPALVLGGLFGTVVDTRDRRVVLVVAGLMAALGALAMPLAATLTAGQRLGFLLASGLLYACGAALYSVGSAAHVPRLARDLPVPQAIGAQASVRNVARIAGLAVAGPAVQCFGAIAGLFAAAAFSLVRTAIVAAIPPARDDGIGQARARRDKTSPWRATLAHDLLRRVLLAYAVMNAGFAMILGAFFSFCYAVLRVSPFSVGAMLFVGGVSAIAASRAIGRLLARIDARQLCAVSGLVAGLAVWLIPLSACLPALPSLFVYEALFSAAATVFAVTFSIVRQRLVPAHMLGKFVAVSSTAAAAAMVGGSLAGAAVIAGGGVVAAILAGCALSSVGALSLIGVARRGGARHRTETGHDPERTPIDGLRN